MSVRPFPLDETACDQAGRWPALDNSWHTGVMPEHSRKKKPTDLNQLAYAIVKESTDEDACEPEDDGKDPNAVALGRKGGMKGGAARANALSGERRREIARAAVAARWAKAESE